MRIPWDNLAIDVTCSGDDLTVRAPKGIVTPEILAELLKHKPVLVAWLTAEERLRSLEADQAQPEEMSGNGRTAAVH